MTDAGPRRTGTIRVEGSVTPVRFPKMVAAATLDWKGQKFYFISEETRREFEKQNGIGTK